MITALPKTFEDGLRSIHTEPEMPLGEVFHSTDEMIYTSYVRFAEAVDVGDAVRTKYGLYTKNNLSPQASGGSVYAPVGSELITEHDATYLTSLADSLTTNPAMPPNPEYRDYGEIAIVGGTGAGQHGVVHEYTNKVLNIRWYSNDSAKNTLGKYTDGTLTTALDATSDYVITAPWYVEKVDAAAGAGTVNGVVLARAKKGEYGLIIYCGTNFIKVQEAVTAGQTIYPHVGSSDDGEGDQPAAVPLFDSYATVLHAGAANALVRAQIRCQPVSIVPNLPQMQDRGFDRPRTSVAA